MPAGLEALPLEPETRIVAEASSITRWEDAPVGFRWRVGTSGAAGLVLAAAAVGTSLGAVDVVELSAQQVVPGSVVTLRVATTATEVRGESGALFMIPSGTFGDSPESLRCEQVGRAVEVGQIHWTAGTVEYEGASYLGVIGEVTFTVPQLAVDTYRLAESITSRGTGCHIFASIEVVAELPDTALPPITQLSGVGQALPAGAGLLAIALVLARLRDHPRSQGSNLIVVHVSDLDSPVPVRHHR